VYATASTGLMLATVRNCVPVVASQLRAVPSMLLVATR
jgi:hypothetical protein